MRHVPPIRFRAECEGEILAPAISCCTGGCLASESQVSVRELKNRTTRILCRTLAGERFTVSKRGHPTAAIELFASVGSAGGASPKQANVSAISIVESAAENISITGCNARLTGGGFLSILSASMNSLAESRYLGIRL